MLQSADIVCGESLKEINYDKVMILHGEWSPCRHLHSVCVAVQCWECWYL